MIKVSVIVPVYNKEKELERCLESLVNQTLKEIEIIVIDDKSKDNSRNIIDKYVKLYPKKVKSIFNKKNSGIGFTRNEGLKVASGEFLGFVDADDYVDLNMFKKYYDFALKHSLDIVTGYYTKFGSEDVLFKNQFFDINNIYDDPSIILKLDYGPCNKIFRNSIVKDKKIKFAVGLKYEDMPFVALALKHSKKVGHINESYYYYYVHENSETTVLDKRVFDIFKIMDMFNEYYYDFSDKSVVEALNILQITRYMLQQKYQKNYDDGIKFINDGYKYLDGMNSKWRKNIWYQKENLFKRFVKNNKLVLKMYCRLCRVLNYGGNRNEK